MRNKLGDTPLHNASWKGHAAIVEALLERGKPAGDSEVLQCISLALCAGTDTTIRNNERQTAYDLAAKNPEVGRLLMVHGGRSCQGLVSCTLTSHFSLADGEAEGYGGDDDSD